MARCFCDSSMTSNRSAEPAAFTDGIRGFVTHVIHGIDSGTIPAGASPRNMLAEMMTSAFEAASAMASGEVLAGLSGSSRTIDASSPSTDASVLPASSQSRNALAAIRQTRGVSRCQPVHRARHRLDLLRPLTCDSGENLLCLRIIPSHSGSPKIGSRTKWLAARGRDACGKSSPAHPPNSCPPRRKCGGLQHPWKSHRSGARSQTRAIRHERDDRLIEPQLIERDAQMGGVCLPQKARDAPAHGHLPQHRLAARWGSEQPVAARRSPLRSVEVSITTGDEFAVDFRAISDFQDFRIGRSVLESPGRSANG